MIVYGELAQLGEHLPCTQGVKSSILLFSTINLKKVKPEKASEHRQSNNKKPKNKSRNEIEKAKAKAKAKVEAKRSKDLMQNVSSREKIKRTKRKIYESI